MTEPLWRLLRHNVSMWHSKDLISVRFPPPLLPPTSPTHQSVHTLTLHLLSAPLTAGFYVHNSGKLEQGGFQSPLVLTSVRARFCFSSKQQSWLLRQLLVQHLHLLRVLTSSTPHPCFINTANKGQSLLLQRSEWQESGMQKSQLAFPPFP